LLWFAEQCIDDRVVRVSLFHRARFKMIVASYATDIVE